MSKRKDDHEVTIEDRAAAVDAAQAEHKRVLGLTERAARHLRAATADLLEIRRVEALFRR